MFTLLLFNRKYLQTTSSIACVRANYFKFYFLFNFLLPLFSFSVLFYHTGYLRPNLEYTVWYRLTDAPEWRTMRIIQKNTMEATIQHLLPGREYEFMVLSQDKYGDGMFSKQFRFSTQRKFNSIHTQYFGFAFFLGRGGGRYL